MTPTYKKIAKNLDESQINKYHHAIMYPWIFTCITISIFVLFGWSLLNVPKENFLLDIEVAGVIVFAGFTIYLWAHKESKLVSAIKPLNLEGMVQYKAIPILIDEIDKSVSWTKIFIQMFMYLLTIAFFAINAFISYLGLHLSMMEPFFEKDKKDLFDMINQTELTLSHTATISFEISMLAAITVVIVLILTIYETALSKRKFVVLCLRETYYNGSEN